MEIASRFRVTGLCRDNNLEREITMRIYAIAILALAAVPAFSQSYAAGTWSDNSVHLLDSNMNNVGSFSYAGALSNGIAADGSSIYVGYFTPNNSMDVYDYSGNFQRHVDFAFGGNLQGFDYFNGEMAVANGSDIDFFDPFSGANTRSLTGVITSTVEGLAGDGGNIWALGDTIDLIDGTTGALIRSISNAAANNSFGGTGLANSGANELTIATADGAWYKVSKTDGSILDSGNNGLDMFGLDTLNPVPEPFSMIALGGGIAALVARRRNKR